MSEPVADGARMGIYVAGHGGLVGSALVRRLRRDGIAPLLRSRAELDLTDTAAVDAFFVAERPRHVYLAAAKVGGILANSVYPADFFRINMAIQLNVLDAARRHGVERLLFLGSSCIYPRDCPQPIREEYLLTGPLERSNRAYALAKIGGIELCAGSNQQYGTRFVAAMPTNLYGPGDNYDPQGSHVLPALIRRFHEAKFAGDPAVTCWGSGRPRREFLYSDDLADACVALMALPEVDFERLALSDPPLINLGCGSDLSIAELASLVAEVVGYRGEIRWDTSRPDGTPRKLLDVSKMQALGWQARIALRDGITRAYGDYLRRHPAMGANAS